MANVATVLVTGNTYPVKDAIKALGGRWDAANKGWRVPADRAEQAKALVSSGRTSGSVRLPRSRFSGGRAFDRDATGSDYYTSGQYDRDS